MIISTLTQLTALPVGSVVLSATNIVYVLDDKAPLWDRPGRLGGTLAEYIALPATVLRDPGTPAAPDEVATSTAAIRYGYAWLNSTYSNHAGLERTFDRWLAAYTQQILDQAHADTDQPADAGGRADELDEALAAADMYRTWPLERQAPERKVIALADEVARLHRELSAPPPPALTGTPGATPVPTRGDALTAGQTLVGEAGGTAYVHDIQRSVDHPKHLVVVTEHGTLYLDPHDTYPALP